MQNDIQINSDKINVILRTSLDSSFHDMISKELENINCTYFTHHLIHNIFRKGHTVSAFGTHLDWETRFWKDYWNSDPLAYASYNLAKINGHSISAWNIVDPDSDVMEYRKSSCNLSTGFSFWIQHKDGVFENFKFGWGKYNIDEMNYEKFLKISNLVSEFRLKHLQANKESSGNYNSKDS